MKKRYEDFKVYLKQEQKEEALYYIIDLIEKQKIDITSIYTDIMTPALNTMECLLEDKNMCIWQEHVQTAIVRCIVECCYPYIIKEKQKNNVLYKGKSIVVCPPEEYHDLGARMVSDFFELVGYSSTFIGANTPIDEIFMAIKYTKPQVVAISVSNYYNLFATKKLIEKIKSITDQKFIIVVGGSAFASNPNCYLEIGADFYIKDFEDIKALADEVSL